MKCSTVIVNGIVARVRGSQPIPACTYCGAPSALLCDYAPAGSGKTCDRKICKDCSVSVGPNVDHCKIHPAPPAQLSLGLS